MARALSIFAAAAAVVAAAAVARAEWTVVTQSALLFGVTAVNRTVMMTGSADSTWC